MLILGLEIVKQCVVVLFGVDRHREKTSSNLFYFLKQSVSKSSLLRRRTRARNMWPILTRMSLPAHFCAYAHSLYLCRDCRETRMLRLNSSGIIPQSCVSGDMMDRKMSMFT